MLLQVRLSRLQDVRDDASNQNGGREAKYKNDLQIFFTISKTAKQIKDSLKITFLYTCSQTHDQANAKPLVDGVQLYNSITETHSPNNKT